METISKTYNGFDGRKTERFCSSIRVKHLIMNIFELN